MNTNEVVAMIDAITEGRSYRLNVETTQSSDEMYLGFDSDAVIFHGVGMSFLATVTDTRTAREIAGALVAWANRKEGKPEQGNNPIADSIWIEGFAIVDKNGNKVKQSNRPVRGDS